MSTRPGAELISRVRASLVVQLYQLKHFDKSTKSYRCLPTPFRVASQPVYFTAEGHEVHYATGDRTPVLRDACKKVAWDVPRPVSYKVQPGELRLLLCYDTLSVFGEWTCYMPSGNCRSDMLPTRMGICFAYPKSLREEP